MEYCKIQHPDISISAKTLYRKWKFLKDNNLDGLIDKRGKGRKGKSKITEEMWQTFLSYYLDEAQHPIQKCYEYTRLYFQDTAPELVADISTNGIVMTGGGSLVAALTVWWSPGRASTRRWRRTPSSAWPSAPARAWTR